MNNETPTNAQEPGGPSAAANASRIARIRELNDKLRTKGTGGELMITRNLMALGREFVGKAHAAVMAFNGFSEDNDPWEEHDCASLSVDGEDIIFKIDYYDPTLSRHSDDAADPNVTRRVLTLMLAEDW
jgi:hypothetical protein